MKMAKSLYNWWKKTEKPAVVEWALVAALILAGYALFMYTDMLITLEDSVQFWDAGFRNFYQYNLEHGTYFSYPPVYELPIYLVFAVWNFPLWLAHHFTGFAYGASAIGLLWAKAMLLVFTAGCAYLVYSIGRLSGLSHPRGLWASFAFLTSASLIIPAFVVAQYDVVALLFILLGVRAWIRGNKKAFVGWFAVAVTLKFFAIIVFVPLVLLQEKRLLRAAGQTLLGCVGLLFCKLLYWGDAAHTASTAARSQQAFGWLLEGTWELGLGAASLFVIGMGLLCVWCYVSHPTKETMARWGVYVPMAAFFLLFSICFFNPYWTVLYVPFVVLAIFQNPQFTKIGLLLDALGEAALALFLAIRWAFVYSVENLRRTVLPFFFRGLTQPKFTYLNQPLEEWGLAKYPELLFGVFIACHIALLILLWPTRRAASAAAETAVAGENTEAKAETTALAAQAATEPIDTTTKPAPQKGRLRRWLQQRATKGPVAPSLPDAPRLERSVVWARALVPVLFMAMMLQLFFVQADQIVLNSEPYIVGASASNLLDADVVITQAVTFDQDLKLTSIGVVYSGSGENTWEGADYLTLRLLDAETGAVLYSGSKSMNQLTWNYWEHYELSVSVRAGHSYVVELSGFRHKSQAVYVALAQQPGFAPAQGAGGPQGASVALLIQAKP